MTRMGLVVLAFAVALATSSARAQGGPENEDSRFTLHRADDGYVRLDGRSGEVSICARRSSGWACQVVPDERAALEAEIARLQSDNVALKRDLLARNLPLPGGVRGEPPVVRGDEPHISLPSDAELNRVMTFMEKVWRRMVEMIVATQKDMMKSP